MVGLGLYVLLIYCGFHFGHVLQGGEINAELLIAALEHCVDSPLELFPTHWETVGKFAVLGTLAPLLVYTQYLRERDLRPMVESGSARWNEDLKKFYQTYTEMTNWPKLFESNKTLRSIKDGIIKFNNFMVKLPLIGALYKPLVEKIAMMFRRPQTETGNKNMIFTKEVYMSMDGRKTQRNNNACVIGGSGAGKSRFLVKPNVLNANCSMVITDPSGELLETMGGFLVQEGYELRVFNLVQMDHSNCYNPFHYIRNQEGVLIMINALIKNTTPKGSNTSDPFWEKAETALLQAICFYLMSECNPEDQNFSNVMKLLRCAKAAEGQEDVDSTLDILFNDLKEREPEHIAVQSYAVFKSAGGGKTAQSILISCQTRLQTFNLDAIKNLTSTDNIDLGSIGDKKVALFCITPSADTTFNYLIALMYTQLFETLYFHAETEVKGKFLKSPVRFLLDEFANIGTIPEFPQKLSTMRKYGISCTIILQALSQIKAMYKDDWEVLLGNCDSLLYLGGNDQTTLEYISKRLGKETIRSVNNSRSYGRQGSHSMSYNKTGRELMTPDELSVMDNKNCILFIRGEYPFFSEKYPYTKHPNYKYTGDASEKYFFDIKEMLHTGKNMKEFNIDNNLPLKVFTEAQKSDTRESDRLHRYHSRPVVKRSARGDELQRIRPLTETFPGIDIPPDQRTREQAEALAAAQDQYVFENIHGLSPSEMARYQDVLVELHKSQDIPEEEMEELDLNS